MRPHPLAVLIIAACCICTSLVFGATGNSTVAAILLTILVSQRHSRTVLRRFSAQIAFVLLFIFILNGVLYPESRSAIGPFGLLHPEGLRFAWGVSARMAVLVLSQVLFFTSAEPHHLAEIFMRNPSTRPVGYAFLVTLSMMRLLQQRLESVAAAQRSRGLRIGGGYRDRIRAILPIIGPVFFSYLRESIDRSMALSLSGLDLRTAYTSMAGEPMTSRDKVVIWLVIMASTVALGVKILA